MNYRWNPLNNAEDYRAIAKRDRDNGRGNGCTVYESTAAMDRAQGGDDRDPLSEFLAELRWRWSDACSQARAQFAWDAYQRDAMGGDSDIPF